MQNDAGEVVDVYIPRKCAYTQRIISAKDHASVQINVAEVDEKTGRITGNYKPYAFCGFLRGSGESDDALNRLCSNDRICSGSLYSYSSFVMWYLLVSSSYHFYIVTAALVFSFHEDWRGIGKIGAIIGLCVLYSCILLGVIFV